MKKKMKKARHATWCALIETAFKRYIMFQVLFYSILCSRKFTFQNCHRIYFSAVCFALRATFYHLPAVLAHWEGPRGLEVCKYNTRPPEGPEGGAGNYSLSVWALWKAGPAWPTWSPSMTGWLTGWWGKDLDKWHDKRKWPQVLPGSFRLGIRKNFYMEWVPKHWNSLPRAVVESLSLEVFKRHVDVAPGDMV